MRYLSVCSGIEAASVAWEPLGWQPLAFSEIEPFPRAVLAHRFPDVPLHGDFTELRHEPWIVDADLLVGGTPCQAFSVAGLRGSLSDERGNLTLEFVRLADAIDDLRRAAGLPPAWVVWENVPGVLSTHDNAFGAFLGGLVGGSRAIDAPDRRGWRGAGVVAGPRRVAAWRILDAQHFGVAQRRRRVFVLALGGAGGWAAADALLPVAASVQGHPAPGREAGERTSPTLAARTRGGGGLGTDLDGGLIHAPAVSPALKARDHKGVSSDGDGDGAPLIAHTLRAAGFDASEDGTGRGQPLVSVAFNAGDYSTGGYVEADQSAALKTGTDRSRNGPVIANVTGGVPFVPTTPAVRRITPREAERLQGLPDDWTLVPAPVARKLEADMLAYIRFFYPDMPVEEAERLAKDGPRYRAVGNAMAVPPVRWIGERIAAVIALLLLLSLPGCASLAGVAESAIPGERFEPPAHYAGLWAEVHTDVGAPITGFARVRWYQVEGACLAVEPVEIDGEEGEMCTRGITYSDGRVGPPVIVLASESVGDDGTVRHEMLHVVVGMLAGHGHPLFEDARYRSTPSEGE